MSSNIQQSFFSDTQIGEYKSREDVKTLLNKTYSDGKKAREFLVKINSGKITADEIAELLYLFINDFMTLGVKFFRLYQGVYKEAITELMKSFRYSDYFVGSIVKQIEASTISRILKGIEDRLAQGQEGSRGILNYLRGYEIAASLLEGKDVDMSNRGVTIIQKFVSSEDIE